VASHTAVSPRLTVVITINFILMLINFSGQNSINVAQNGIKMFSRLFQLISLGKNATSCDVTLCVAILEQGNKYTRTLTDGPKEYSSS
jgi:hypothetical protein